MFPRPSLQPPRLDAADAVVRVPALGPVEVAGRVGGVDGGAGGALGGLECALRGPVEVAGAGRVLGALERGLPAPSPAGPTRGSEESKQFPGGRMSVLSGSESRSNT